MMTGNKWSGKTKHVVSIGGGLSSTIELPLEVIRRYGHDNVDFFICALKGESPDLWRMVDWVESETGKHVTRVAWTPYENDIHYNLRANYWIDAPEWAYSDIWDVFFREGVMGNSRIDPCSRVLKRETAMAYLKDTYDFANTTLHVGIGYDEIDRMMSIQKRYHSAGLQVDAILADDEYLKSKPLSWHGMTTAQKCAETIGFVPFVYSWGGNHNNCGGFCVKAGKAHMKNFLMNDRDTYLYHENREREFRQRFGTDATIMKEQRNNKTVYITMEEFRLAIESTLPLPFELDDTPACRFCEAA